MFLKLKDNYGKKNTEGRPKALSWCDERRFGRLASLESTQPGNLLRRQV